MFEYDFYERVGESDELEAYPGIIELVATRDVDALILEAQDCGDTDRVIGLLMLQAWFDEMTDDRRICYGSLHATLRLDDCVRPNQPALAPLRPRQWPLN